MPDRAKKIAIVLFNLGGPDRPEAVKPFLFNLFNDPAIIGLPNPFRTLLAKLISSRREHEAQEIYAQIGNSSPILPLTEDQAHAIEQHLNSDTGSHTYKTFIAMRYWHPFTEEAIEQVKAWGADEIQLLPLYPQFSTTTSGSSLNAWHKEAAVHGLSVPTKTICCYPTQAAFIASHATLIRAMYHNAEEASKTPPRILFSAHGLPEKIIKKGDPYQWQVEQTAAAVVDQLAIQNLDWQICYQSKVGPLKWIGPATDDEILRAAKTHTPLIIVPIAFVSEHSETLVELDIQYKELAAEHGLSAYYRVPALATEEQFITALASSCQQMTEAAETGIINHRYCPAQYACCPNTINALSPP